MKTILYIPTLNAGTLWPKVVTAINQQSLVPDQKVIIDSGSTDGTLQCPGLQDYQILTIDKKDFDHGGTRQMAVETFPGADLYIFLTQDAILSDNKTLERLVQVFTDHPDVGVAYGRQLPHQHAKTLEAHARLFNYPAQSQMRSLANSKQYGIKTVSCSNSFAAYRRTAFEEGGGFPSGTILGEDVIAAGNIVLNGWKLAYVAEAAVYHSHNYSPIEEFKRYFDIGVFHAQNAWIFAHFGHAESEGLKYVKSEFKYALKHNWLALPKAFSTNLAKWLGYKLGLHYKRLPKNWKVNFSMHKAYWSKTYLING